MKVHVFKKCITAVLISLLLKLPDVHSSHNYDPSVVDAQHGNGVTADATKDSHHTDIVNEDFEVRRGLQRKKAVWWERVSIDFAHVVNLHQCAKKRLPPVDGATCSKKAKTCFFGDQKCPAGDLYPSLQCFCDGNGKARGTWTCTTVACPPLPESIAPAPTIVPATPAPTIGTISGTVSEDCTNASDCPYIDNIPNNCPWTRWYDTDNRPGFGDSELFLEWSWRGRYACPGKVTPLAIECQAYRFFYNAAPGLTPVPPIDAHDTGEIIVCNRFEGYNCDYEIQPDRICDYDVRVRFQCPCKTPAPVTPLPSPSPTAPPTPAPVTPPSTGAPTTPPTPAPVTPAPTPSPTTPPTPAPVTPPPTGAPITPAPTIHDDCHNIPNECPLTDWYDLDNPSGYGDYEQPSVWATRGGPLVCPDGATPLSIECQAFRHVTASAGLIPVPADAHDTGEVIKCNRCDGFYCENPFQPDGRCDYDYRVRFQCPCSPNVVNITLIDPTPAPVTAPTIPPTIGTVSGTVEEDTTPGTISGTVDEDATPGTISGTVIGDECNNIPSSCPWTDWYDFDSPRDTGDYEDLSGYAAKGIVVCPGGASPLSVECQATRELLPSGALVAITPVNAWTTGEVIVCDKCQGLYCVNSAQPDGRCDYDYAIRFQCPCGL